MSDVPETIEKMSDDPEISENNSALETAVSPLPGSSSSLPNLGLMTTEKMSNDPEETIEKILNQPPEMTVKMANQTKETIEKMSDDPETSENNTAPEVAASPLPGSSSSLLNMGLTSTPKRSETRNRRFKQPKKLLINANADEVFLSCPDFSTLAPDQEEDEGKMEDDDNDDDDDDDDDDEDEDDDDMKAKYTPQAKRLSKFLKYSPSHSWVWYEFGESLVDAAVQRGAYDMGSFMAEYCAQVKSRLLPRRGWQLLRRNLGKARLFSPGFIQAEQQEMERSRQFVRQLQQGKPVRREEHAFVEQIYRGVPLPLTKDAKVSVFLKGHGIVNGVIVRFNPEDSSYLVKCVLSGQAVELTLPDILIQSQEEFIGLSIPHLMKIVDPNEDIFKKETIATEPNEGDYSDELVEALMDVKRLTVVKAKALQELAAKNDAQENATKPLKGQALSVNESFEALYRVNDELQGPLCLLHEWLTDQKYKMKVQEARARTAFERYLKCCNQAEIDMKTMETMHKLIIKSPITRGFYKDLQTILYLTGELGRPNTDEIMLITDNMIAYMIKTLDPEVSAEFEIKMNELKPLRQRIADQLKKKPAGPLRCFSEEGEP